MGKLNIFGGISKRKIPYIGIKRSQGKYSASLTASPLRSSLYTKNPLFKTKTNLDSGFTLFKRTKR